MNKTFKTILIISIAILGAGFLAVLPAKAIEVDELVVEYSVDGGNNWLSFSAAIFNETNFLPGQDVTRLIRVTNYSELIQRIAVETINETNIGDLASQVDIAIKEGSNTIYNKTLKQFFDDGEIYLSSLAGFGGQTQYDFTVSFDSGAGDDYQGKSAGFNLIVGFQGTEGGLILPEPGGNTGGGGGLPPGLTISNQSDPVATDVSVLITWNTSYPATSYVIYALEGEKHLLDLTDNSGAPPKYGYERATPESDISPKVIDHFVTITGLISGAKYYYRTVSHGSLAISSEQSFTTLSAKSEEESIGKEIFEEQSFNESGIFGENKKILEKITDGTKGIIEKETALSDLSEEIISPKEMPQRGFTSLLATISSVWGGTVQSIILIIIVILCLVGLVFISVREWRSFQEKRRK